MAVGDAALPGVVRVHESDPFGRSHAGGPVSPAHPVPPVVIGRIDIHVTAPEPEADPFAGLRAVEGGLTARRGGGW